MQMDVEDIQALGDSLDKVLAGYPAGVASLDALKNPGVLRQQTEQKLDELGVRYLFNAIASEGVDLRAMALLAERCGRSLFHGASLFQDVIGTYVASRLTAFPIGLSAEDFGSGVARMTVALDNDPCGDSVVATRKGEGWILNGKLAVVPYAAESTHVLVSAKEESGGKALHFLVKTDAKGLKSKHGHGADGTALSSITLEAVALSADAMLGTDAPGEALAQAKRHATLLLCFEAVGLMEQIMFKTRDYLQIRKQFGKAIGSFQALQHRMVGVLLMLEQTRSAAHLALNAMLNGADDQNMRLSAAKHAVGINGQKVAEECIQLHGGIGMTWELDVSHYAKRLVMLDHYFDNADQSLQQVMDAL